MVANNTFREDLLFRLNVFPIDVPNLSQRHEDIPEIIEHFIEKKHSKTGSSSRPIFDEKALQILQNYHQIHLSSLSAYHFCHVGHDQCFSIQPANW